MVSNIRDREEDRVTRDGGQVTGVQVTHVLYVYLHYSPYPYLLSSMTLMLLFRHLTVWIPDSKQDTS